MRPGLWSYGGLTRRELVRRVWRKMSEDNVWDSAAQLAYYFLLALFPLLIVLLSLVALAPGTDLVRSMMETLEGAMPDQAFDLVEGEVARILGTSNGKWLTFGMLGALWASSSGVVSLMATLDRIFCARERRGWLHLRATSLGLTVVLIVLMVTGGLMVAVGHNAVAWLTIWANLGVFSQIASIAVNYALGIAILVVALEIALYFGPDGHTRSWHWITPGSVVGVVLFALSTWGFTSYLSFHDSYSITYGSIGAVIVLMLWLYLLGLSILVGAEVNSVIYQARGCAPDEPPALKN